MAELKRKSPWDEPTAATAVVEEVQTYSAPKPEPLPVQVPMRRINFDVPADLHRRMRQRALDDDVTIAEAGRRMFEEWADRPR